MLETKATFEVEAIGGVYEISATVRFYPGCAARTYGLPENCHPDEPGEVEIFDINICGVPYLATDKQVEQWQELVLESPENYFAEQEG